MQKKPKSRLRSSCSAPPLRLCHQPPRDIIQSYLIKCIRCGARPRRGIHLCRRQLREHPCRTRPAASAPRRERDPHRRAASVQSRNTPPPRTRARAARGKGTRNRGSGCEAQATSLCPQPLPQSGRGPFPGIPPGRPSEAGPLGPLSLAPTLPIRQVSSEQ